MSPFVHAAGSGGFGLSVGLGSPFLTQAGLNYKMSDRVGFSLGYNLLDLSLGTAGVKLAMPELLVHYHPFMGSYFVALGVGQETLDVTASDLTTGYKTAVNVTAMTGIVKTGWMWGIGNNGFWFGVDASYIMPSGATQSITAPGVPTTDPSYQDALDAAKKFGETAYMNITFARMGWIF